MQFISGALAFFSIYFLINGYRRKDDTQKMLGWVFLIAAFGTGFILFLVMSN
ncbi:MAG: hypothetical protein ACD_66C00010G0002 [uncultured bacterium]|nr:MAG: hypothetical protein ACD_66C00010G0002 [uncultured bacterium]